MDDGDGQSSFSLILWCGRYKRDPARPGMLWIPTSLVDHDEPGIISLGGMWIEEPKPPRPPGPGGPGEPMPVVRKRGAG
jgi:hypothetical protein